MKVLLAIDLRDEDVEALIDRAARWAGRLHATLDLVWVDPFGTWKPFTLDRTLARQLEEQLEQSRQRDHDRLQLLLDRIPFANRGVARALKGEAVEAIPEAARGYDLLVIGPGEQLTDKLGLGSRENGIIRRSPVNVLVMCSKSEEPSEPGSAEPA